MKRLIKKIIYNIKPYVLRSLGQGCETADMLRKRGVEVGERLQNYGIIDNGHGYLISIGDDVIISSARILAHDGSTKIWTGYSRIGRVKIGNRVFIGAGVTILPNVTIGDDVIIGAGSVVSSNIPSNSVAVGAPAKVISALDKYIEKHRAKMNEQNTWHSYWKNKSKQEINNIKETLKNSEWGGYDI